MSTVERIRRHLERNFEGRPWYGDAIPKALEGLTADRAAARPIAAAHSIWEILLHMIAWKQYAKVISGVQAYSLGIAPGH